MNTPLIRAATAAVITLSAPLAAQRLTGPNPRAGVPEPVALDTTGMFYSHFAKVGDDVFIGGQPTEKALRYLKTQGVTTVVNLRTPPEMDPARIGFDEAALVRQLGMKYVYLPMRGTAEYPYSPEAVKSFAAAMRDAKGKVLLHCTIAWRASHMWAAYLIADRGLPVETALKHARMINLMDNMRMDGNKQPVEEFLGRTLLEVGHPGKG
jgi:uncharacterized protein (TIGR01244 family)